MIIRKYLAVPCLHDSKEWAVATGKYQRPPSFTKAQAEAVAELLNKMEEPDPREYDALPSSLAKKNY